MKVHQEPLFYIVDCFIIILFSDSTHLKTLQVMLRSFIMELITQILPPSCIIWWEWNLIQLYISIYKAESKLKYIQVILFHFFQSHIIITLFITLTQFTYGKLCWYHGNIWELTLHAFGSVRFYHNEKICFNIFFITSNFTRNS